jgi:hypothetical protein
LLNVHDTKTNHRCEYSLNLKESSDEYSDEYSDQYSDEYSLMMLRESWE